MSYRPRLKAETLKPDTRRIKIAVCDEQGVILDSGTFEVPAGTATVAMKWLAKGKEDIWGDAQFDLGK